MKISFASLLLSFAIALTATVPAEAFKLIPISRVFTPAGSGATQSYEIVNDGEEPIAVEISVVERNVALDGRESYAPADEEFLVYPPQMILNPNQTQVVRVTWLGDPQPLQELAYRLIAEQLPIELVQSAATSTTQPTGAVQVALRYAGSIFIRPNNVAADVVLDGVQSQVDPAGAP
ncbi:MAG: molecular chaperone [Prochlorotrichaceae cyanobacterium]|jgi:fimbrial chaperone protein